MTPTPEQIAAYADGQLDGDKRETIEAAVAADPALQCQVEKHRALSAMLTAHYAPLMNQELPERLTASLQSQNEPEMVDFAAARERRNAARKLPRWSWVAGPALAASLALAVILPRGGSDDLAYADGALASALYTQLSATQANDAQTRILLSFADAGGDYCRAFTTPDGSGIACHNDRGWKLEQLADGAGGAATEYRQAGSDIADILEAAQAMAAAGALDAEAEAEAAAKGWQD